MEQSSIKDPVDQQRMREAENLLSRYPEVDDREIERLLKFMKEAPALEVALLSCKDHLKSPLDRFRQDHRSQFELSWARVALACVICSAIVAAAVAWLSLA